MICTRKSGTKLKHLSLFSRTCCSLELVMVAQQIFLRSSAVGRTQNCGRKHSLGIVLPWGPVRLSISNGVTWSWWKPASHAKDSGCQGDYCLKFYQPLSWNEIKYYTHVVCSPCTNKPVLRDHLFWRTTYSWRQGTYFNALNLPPKTTCFERPYFYGQYGSLSRLNFWYKIRL